MPRPKPDDKPKVRDQAKRLADIRLDLAFLSSERSNWESHWRELCDYILPHRGRFPDQGRGTDDGRSRMDKVVDSTAYRARRILASGLMSGLTSPSRPWFKLGLSDQDLARRQDVKLWLSQVEERMREALSQSNFYNSIHALYEELSAFGTGVLTARNSNDPSGDATGKGRAAPTGWRGLRFQALTVGEYYLSVNMDGDVDTVFRCFTMPARSLEQEYGKDRLTDATRRLLETSPFKHVEVVQVIRPSRPESRTVLPWECVTFERNAGTSDPMLEDAGLREFPYMVARWDVSGWDTYGRGPGMVALPDVKMLQELARDRLKAVKKSVDPPLTMPASLKDRVKTFPGGLNYVDAASHPAARPLYQIAPDMGSLSVSIEDTRAAIRDGFFNDLFLMLASSRSNQPVTAREIAERHEEKLLVLGPVIERLHSELLSPITEWTFSVCLRNGRFTEPPRVLAGRGINVDFISTLSQAQKMVGTQSIEAVTAFAGQVAKFSPSVLDKINLDKVVDRYADLLGAPADIVRPDEEVAAIRAQRAQQAQAAQGVQAAQAAIQGAQTLSQTPTDGQNALTDLLGQGGNA